MRHQNEVVAIFHQEISLEHRSVEENDNQRDETSPNSPRIPTTTPEIQSVGVGDRRYVRYEVVEVFITFHYEWTQKVFNFIRHFRI